MKNELGVVIDELCTGNLSSGEAYARALGRRRS